MQATLNPPATVNRWLGLERLDSVLTSGAQRWILRLAAANAARPDFIWSPYPDFTSGLDQTTWNVAAGAISAFRPSLVNEAASSQALWDRWSGTARSTTSPHCCRVQMQYNTAIAIMTQQFHLLEAAISERA